MRQSCTCWTVSRLRKKVHLSESVRFKSFHLLRELGKKTNLMLRWETPGAFMAVHAEAALPGYPDQPWVGAWRRGWWQLVVAERSAANSAIDAGTLVFTAGTEALAILVDPAVILACAPLWFCWRDTFYSAETKHLMTFGMLCKM